MAMALLISRDLFQNMGYRSFTWRKEKAGISSLRWRWKGISVAPASESGD
jgi:hypothetical protein